MRLAESSAVTSLPPLKFVTKGLDSENWSPRYSPPSCKQTDQAPEQPFFHCAFSGRDEVNIRRTPKAHHKDRDGVLIENELGTLLDFELYPVRRHSLNALNFHKAPLIDLFVPGKVIGCCTRNARRSMEAVGSPMKRSEAFFFPLHGEWSLQP